MVTSFLLVLTRGLFTIPNQKKIDEKLPLIGGTKEKLDYI